MTLATYELMVDWDGQGTFGGTAADVTARALSVEWGRGRDYASQLVGKSVAGRFSAVLNNESGDYSPFNTSSPITGLILPGRLVRLAGTSVRGWVSPTGHDDPVGVWSDEAKAYDGATLTAASTSVTDAGEWLYLTLSAIDSNAIRFWAAVGHLGGIQIDIHRNDVWEEIYNDLPDLDAGWIEVTFAAGQVDQARIKFNDQEPGSVTFYLYEFQFGAVYSVLWTGYLETIVPQPSVKGLAVARLDAVGPMGYYGPKKINLGHHLNITTGTMFTTLCQQVATVGTAWLSLIDGGQTTMTRVWFDQVPFIDAIQECEDTEAGFVWESKTGLIGFADRHHRLSAGAQTSKATFSDAGTGLTYVDLSEDDAIQTVFNALETSVQLYGTGTLGTLWTLAIAGTSYPQLNRTGEVLTVWAEYPTPDAPSDDIAVDSWTTPTSGVDYFANSQANGSGVDRSSNVVMTVSKFGNRMRMALSNNNPTADIWLTSLNARGVPVQKLDPITVGVQDDTSGTLYGTRDYPNPAKLVPTLGEADNWARFHLGIFKDPQPVLSVSIIGNRNDAHMAEVFSRDISDRVTIVGTGPAGLGINEDFFIEAERHHIDARREHRVTWLLSRAAGFSDWWVMDYSRLGTNTRVAY